MQLQNFRSGRGRSNQLVETRKLNGYATVPAAGANNLSVRVLSRGFHMSHGVGKVDLRGH